MILSSVILLFSSILEISHAQGLKSPCPSVLKINQNSIDVGTWGGKLELHLDRNSQGIFMQIDMDGPVDVITNNFGMLTTKNNQKYLLEDFSYKPKDQKTEIQFNIKYNGANLTPQIEKVYINGLLKCPEGKKQDKIPRNSTIQSRKRTRPSKPIEKSNLERKIEGPATTTTEIHRETTTKPSFKPIPFFDIDDE